MDPASSKASDTEELTTKPEPATWPVQGALPLTYGDRRSDRLHGGRTPDAALQWCGRSGFDRDRSIPGQWVTQADPLRCPLHVRTG
jgi:hypothetical protein